MKVASALILIFLPLLLFSQTPPQKVRVYTNDNFSGSHGDFGIGKYSNSQLASHGAYVVYSLKIPKGLRVTLFPEDNFKGKALVLTEDTTQPILLDKGFANGRVSVSMVVDVAPTTPVAVVSTKSNVPVITLFKDNFDGDHYELPVGQYEFTEIGIGNDQLSSVKIPKGMKVTLYEHEGFAGKSLILTKDAGASYFVSNGFNDVTSSLIVEMVPEVPTVTPVVTPTVTPVVVPVVTVVTVDPVPVKEVEVDQTYTGPVVTLYSDNFKGRSWRLTPGIYNYDNDFGMPANAPFSMLIPSGLNVTLYDSKAVAEDGSIETQGRKLLLTRDTDANYIKSNGFAGSTWWVAVREVAPVESDPVVTIYRDDFSGPSRNFAPGRYGYQDLGIGDNALSSISIPRGLKVTLYELPAFEGRTAVLTTDTGADFLVSKQFNDITSALLVETIPSADLNVIIFKDDFSGASKSLAPGRYNAQDLGIGDNQLSSVKIPQGMRVTLFENDNFTGRSMALTKNTNAGYMVSSKFNDLTSSLVVEDVPVPFVTPVPVEPVTHTVVPVVVPAVTPVVEIPVVPVVEVPSCELTGKEYDAAMNAMKSKRFRDELMTTAKLATKDKCLTVDQVRSFTQFFSFSDQKLEFVKYAYNLSSEKSAYYTLDDVFVFMSDKEAFSKFLSSK